MTLEKLADLHDAAKRIEVDGIEGYRSVASLYGSELADALLVAHLRRANGAMESFPPPPRATTDTNDILIREGLVEI